MLKNNLRCSVPGRRKYLWYKTVWNVIRSRVLRHILVPSFCRLPSSLFSFLSPFLGSCDREEQRQRPWTNTTKTWPQQKHTDRHGAVSETLCHSSVKTYRLSKSCKDPNCALALNIFKVLLGEKFLSRPTSSARIMSWSSVRMIMIV